MSEAKRLIERLGLAAHPEGGWYRETWRAPTTHSERAASTAILFLLESDQRSHWHRVDADEIWMWQAGDPLDLHIAADETAQPKTIRLGPAVDPNCVLQGVVPALAWQAAEPAEQQGLGYVLVSCVVAPGFLFDTFELAPQGWRPGA